VIKISPLADITKTYGKPDRQKYIKASLRKNSKAVLILSVLQDFGIFL